MIAWIRKLAARWRRPRLRIDAVDVAEFREIFPGRCMICSYADFAFSNGVDLRPIAHRCIEGRGDGPPTAPPIAKVVRR